MANSGEDTNGSHFIVRENRLQMVKSMHSGLLVIPKI